jgi:hypothetical protein
MSHGARGAAPQVSNGNAKASERPIEHIHRTMKAI